MHNCALPGTLLGGGLTLRPHVAAPQLHQPARCGWPVARASPATAAIEHDISTDDSSTPASEHAVAGAAAVSSTASARRRRRSVTASNAEPGTAASAKGEGKQQQKSRGYATAAELQQLFAQAPAPMPSSRVRRVSRTQPVVLPAGAEQDATKVAAATRKAAAQAKAQAQLEQQVDPQVLAGFRPFAQSFHEAARSGGTAVQSKPDAQQDAATPPAADAGRGQQRDAQRTQRAPPSPQQQQPSAQQGAAAQAKLPPIKRDFIELFSPKTTAQGLQPPQVTRVSRDTPAPLPDAAKAATQQLSHLIAARQQRQQQQQQQQQQLEGAQPPAGAGAAAGPAAAPEQEEAAAEPLQQLLGGQVQAPAAGVTRIYTPAPPKRAAASEADRQPLRLMSLRQQQQMREEARKAAVLKLRERSVREYEGTLQAMLAWQPSTPTRFYLPGAPTHFPVVVQRQWDALGHTASSTQQAATPAAGDQPLQDAAALQQPEPPAVRQLSLDEQQTLVRLSAVLQQQLGAGLPDRALRGERSLLLASLSPEAVRERLGRWVGCCGREYVGQLMGKEPTLLGHEPQVLLATLEAVNSHMQLTPKESVALVLKQPALIGLDSAELQGRLKGLAEAVGCDMAAAARLAAHSAALVMLHPDYVKERMAALAQLLPEAAAKLPRDVVRHPYVLSKSPRAVARNILQMSDALELSSWATCRLVAGQPSLLNTNYDTLRNRLDRLQQLATPVRRWNRELLAMSPPALARCLSASDAAIGRLQALTDIGAANSRRLPPINKILTMPAQYWEALLQEVAAARERAVEGRAAAAITAAAAAAAASEQAGEAAAAEGSVGGVATSAQAAARAAARAALARARSRSVSPGGSAAGSAVQSLEEGDGIMGSEAAGLLGGDASWRSSLTSALIGAAADLKAQWLGSKQEGSEQQGGSGRGEPEPAVAGAGGSRYRRRR